MCFVSEHFSQDCRLLKYTRPKLEIMCRSFSKTTHPPAHTPGHLTFVKNFGQIPRYVASLEGQMPVRAERGSNHDPWTRRLCWIKELRNPFVSDRWDTFWQESQLPLRAGLILGQISHCTERSLTCVKSPGIGRGDGWFVHSTSLTATVSTVQQKGLSLN